MQIIKKKFPTTIILNFLSPAKKEIEILSDKYKVIFNFKDSFYTLYDILNCKEIKIEFDFTRNDMFTNEIRSFVNGDKQNNLVNFSESLKSLSLIKEIKKIIKI